MGKSINGKELGQGISQRKSDGLYQGRFVNRFGKRVTLYDETYNGIQKKLREARYEDEKCINVVSNNMTLDEWYSHWMDSFKKDCRGNTRDTYARHYKRIKNELGWRKLNQLNLVVMQNAINNLDSDNERKNSKKILVDMLDKAIESNLLVKNTAKQIKTDITKEEKQERRVLTESETKVFLDKAESSFYYELFVLALETGMRIGELTGLMWSDIDLKAEKKMISVKHSLTYYSKDSKYIFELHPTKTGNGKREIPLTKRAIEVLENQKKKKQKIVESGKKAMDGYEDLVFVTKNNNPTTMFLVKESINGIVKQINKENKELNFERFSPHTFRHTFATRYLEAQVPLKTLSKLLGHARTQLTLDLYCHATADALYDGVMQYENYINGRGNQEMV